MLIIGTCTGQSNDDLLNELNNRSLILWDNCPDEDCFEKEDTSVSKGIVEFENRAFGGVKCSLEIKKKSPWKICHSPTRMKSLNAHMQQLRRGIDSLQNESMKTE